MDQNQKTDGVLSVFSGFTTGLLLFISVLLNISGLASLIDGFVVWVGFFRDIVTNYRTFTSVTVEPVFRLFLQSPPQWLSDYAVVSSALLLSSGLTAQVLYKQPLWAIAREEGLGYLRIIFGIFLQIIIQPIVLTVLALLYLARVIYRDPADPGRREFLVGFVSMLVIFALLMVAVFVNYQISKI